MIPHAVGSRRNVTPHGTAPSFADMSAQQRAASMDNIVRQVAMLTASNNALVEQLREHRAMLDAHAGVVSRRTLIGRLRWIVTGV